MELSRNAHKVLQWLSRRERDEKGWVIARPDRIAEAFARQRISEREIREALLELEENGWIERNWFSTREPKRARLLKDCCKGEKGMYDNNPVNAQHAWGSRPSFSQMFGENPEPEIGQTPTHKGTTTHSSRDNGSPPSASGDRRSVPVAPQPVGLEGPFGPSDPTGSVKPVARGGGKKVSEQDFLDQPSDDDAIGSDPRTQVIQGSRITRGKVKHRGWEKRPVERWTPDDFVGYFLDHYNRTRLMWADQNLWPEVIEPMNAGAFRRKIKVAKDNGGSPKVIKRAIEIFWAKCEPTGRNPKIPAVPWKSFLKQFGDLCEWAASDRTFYTETTYEEAYSDDISKVTGTGLSKEAFDDLFG